MSSCPFSKTEPRAGREGKPGRLARSLNEFGVSALSWTCVVKSGAVEPAQEAFAFLSAQRFFIASDSLFLPAGVSRPRLFGAAVLGDNLFDRRFAQRRFIASDKRRRPSGVMPLRLLRATFRVGPLAFKPAPSSRAVIARCIFSLSRFNSAMILSSSVPLGYDLSDHRLVVNAAEAEGETHISSLSRTENPSSSQR